MSRPNAPNRLPDPGTSAPYRPPASGASASTPSPSGGAQILADANTRQITDSHRANLERRGEYLRMHIATHYTTRALSGHDSTEITNWLMEYDDIGRQLGRELPPPFEWSSLYQERFLSRTSRNPPLAPLHREVRTARASATGHHHSGHSSREPGAVVLPGRPGNNAFNHVSPYATNSLQPLAPPQAQPLPGESTFNRVSPYAQNLHDPLAPPQAHLSPGDNIFNQTSPYAPNPLDLRAPPQAPPPSGPHSGRLDSTPSSALHDRRLASDSGSQDRSTRVRAEIPSVLPHRPALGPAAAIPTTRPPSTNAYANVNATNRINSVSQTHFDPMIPRANHDMNSSYLLPASGVHSRLPTARVLTRPTDAVGGYNFVGSALRRNLLVGSNLQRNGSRASNPPGTQLREENSQGNQPSERESTVDSESDVPDRLMVELPRGTLNSILERVRRERANYATPMSLSSISGPPERPRGLDVDDGRPPAKTDEEMQVNLSCSICYSQRASVALFPCGKTAPCFWFEVH